MSSRQARKRKEAPYGECAPHSTLHLSLHLSLHVISCDVMSCHVISCDVMSCRGFTCIVFIELSHHITSYHIISHHITSYHICPSSSSSVLHRHPLSFIVTVVCCLFVCAPGIGDTSSWTRPLKNCLTTHQLILQKGITSLAMFMPLCFIFSNVVSHVGRAITEGRLM